ncbi:MAG: arylsulfatase [Maribacter sp.]|uniref:sulfatase family protein n=1 Tax=Maribacter sp. TaxID=1897614 RepID=UPI003C78417C
MKTIPSLFLLLVSLGVFFLGGCKEAPKAVKTAEQLPNIIYILADDLGYGDIHAFNPNGKIATPNIDALATNGIKFTDAHTSSAVCTPTRYGILTGRYNWRSPIKSGVLTGKSKALIPKQRTTVASLVKRKGYTTAFIGKWHLGWDWAFKDSTDFGGEGWNFEDFDTMDFDQPITNGPNDLGFDYAYGHSGSLDMAPYIYIENGRPTAPVDRITVDTGKYTWWRKGPTASDFIHEEVTPNFFKKAISYIEEKAIQDHPFFLYLALPSPHTPIVPTKEWQGKSGLNPYGDFVVMMDDYVGELVEVLAQNELTENTIVIFTSDNGCSPQADFEILRGKGHDPSGNFRGHKADIFEGGHRVPFVVQWPKYIAANSISEETICTTDLMATLADIVKIDLGDNEGEDSYSMLPIFMDSNTTDFKREATVHHSINGSFAIRKDQWKMIFCLGSGGWSDPKPNAGGNADLPVFQLYDLAVDPGEQTNLYGNHPEVEHQLQQLMLRYIEDGRSTPGTKQENDPEGYGSKDWKQLEMLKEKINKT